MRYRPELDLALKDVCVKIRGGERVGVCGRTGAGKSSLTLALFRIIEPASGRVLIDGIDTSIIGLRDLRSIVSIIPQDPELFEGTLRDNLDPTRSASDHLLWQALSQAHLKDYVTNRMGGSLDAVIAEGGGSKSVLLPACSVPLMLPKTCPRASASCSASPVLYYGTPRSSSWTKRRARSILKRTRLCSRSSAVQHSMASPR